MPLFNDEVNSTVSPHPGFISGRYYTSGFYQSFSTSALAVGVVYYTYLFVPFNQAFTAIAFQVNNPGSATQTARLAIYTIKNGLPSSLIRDFGEISSLNTGGIKEISNSFSLTPGWYAIAFATNGTTATFLCPSISFSNLIGVTTIGSIINGYRANATYGATLNIASVAGLLATASPVIWLKAA
jgi:hypothetical protein